MHQSLFCMFSSRHNALFVYMLVLFCSGNIVATPTPIVPTQWVVTATEHSTMYRQLISYIDDNNLRDFIDLLMQEQENLVYCARSGEEKKLFFYAVQQGHSAFVAYLLQSPTISDNMLSLRQAVRIAYNHAQWENALVILVHCRNNPMFRGKQFLAAEIERLIPAVTRLIGLPERRKSV